MAVRRISELPNLTANYGVGFDLGKSLIEVSYNPKDKIYQSFYTDLNTVLVNISNNVLANLPRASKNRFGIVKIGDNINVNDGLISVPNATTTTQGVVKAPGGNWSCVATDSNGNFIQGAFPEVTQTVVTDYAVMNAAYPIGGLMILANNATPTSGDNWEWGRTYDDAKQSQPEYRVGASKWLRGNVYDYIFWYKWGSDKSLWSSLGNQSYKAGVPLAGSLPQTPTYTAKSAGGHTHAIAMAGSGGGSWADEPDGDNSVFVGSGSSSPYDPTNPEKWSTTIQTGYAQFCALSAGTYIASSGTSKVQVNPQLIYDAAKIWQYVSTKTPAPNAKSGYGFLSADNATIEYYATHHTNNLATALTQMATYYSANGKAGEKRNPYYTGVNKLYQYLKYAYRTLIQYRERMEFAGEHEHIVEATGGSPIYRNDSSTIVRPTSVTVAIWQRVDYDTYAAIRNSQMTPAY